MGCCVGQSKDKYDVSIQSHLNDAKKIDSQTKKLLLLGAGGSGKTTLFKQIQNIHGGGFTSLDRRTYVIKIYEQIIESIKLMLVRCIDFVEKGNNKFLLTSDPVSIEFIHNLPLNGNVITEEIAYHIKILWKDPAIQEAYQIRNKICIPDSTKYYLDDIDRLIKPDYVPTDNDLFLVRYRTTGMTEKEFIINSTTIKIIDVGGQRNERKKWMHHFDGVTSVIFVASLACYDEVPFEDEEGNSMSESLQVFSEHINSKTFFDKPFILFLNKCDLFKEKIQRVSLKVCFGDEYVGKDFDYDDGVAFIRKKFEAYNNNHDREIYSHTTCATDTENINSVFRDIQNIILRGGLEASGIL